ncbi:MAG: valine--tRNA ligase, partial [Armatimonadetes bacterium]|nr:valine--tRNA ligase [Armatimonadota bacterium]
RPEGPAATATVGGIEVIVPMAGAVDLDAERKRAQKELDGVRKELSGVEGKLSNGQFLERAPAEIVEKQRRIQAELRERVVALEARLQRLGGLS